MYYFIVNNYVLEEQIEYGFCYFCEFISPKAHKISKDNGYHYLCDECVMEWDIRKNDVEKLSDTLYKINDSFTNPVIKYDAIYFDENGSYANIVYYRMIIPINIFSYPLLLTIDKQKYDDECDFHFYDKHYSNDFYKNENPIYVCQDCLNYALQLFIDQYYKKYMLIKNILVDVDIIVIRYFITLLIKI
jgi:hypothetical protein